MTSAPSVDHHRLLQRARRPRALPRVAARRAAGGVSRDPRRRQRLDRRQRGRRAALAGRPRDRGRRQPRVRARQQRRHPRQQRREPAAAEQRHRRASRRDRSAARRARTASRRRRRRSAARRRERPRRAVVRTDDRPAQRAAAEVAGSAARSSELTRRAAVSGLGERRVPARAARRRGSGRPARRALFHVHGGRRLLRRDPRAGTPHPLHAGRRGRAPARPIRGQRPGRHARRLPPQPAGVLRETPPGWAPLLQLYLTLRRR